MSTSDTDHEKARPLKDAKILRQVAFASGLFQGDVTIRPILESLAEGVVVIDESGTISAGQYRRRENVQLSEGRAHW